MVSINLASSYSSVSYLAGAYFNWCQYFDTISFLLFTRFCSLYAAISNFYICMYMYWYCIWYDYIWYDWYCTWYIAYRYIIDIYKYIYIKLVITAWFYVWSCLYHATFLPCHVSFNQLQNQFWKLFGFYFVWYLELFFFLLPSFFLFFFTFQYSYLGTSTNT